MARTLAGPVQYYGGTTAQHAGYTGAQREMTVDTTKWTLVVHDGATAGGHPLVKESTVVTGDTILRVNGADSAPIASGFALTVDVTAAAAALISGDANNGLGLGSDNLLVVNNATGLVADGDELLHVTDDGKIATGIELDYDPTTGKFTVSNHAGTEVASTVVPTASSVLEDVNIVTDPADQPAGTYFEFIWRVTTDDAGGTETKTMYVDVTQFFDVYTAGLGITVTGKEIAAKVKAGGGITVDAEGLSAVPGEVISADAPNILVQGTDQKLLVKPYVAGDGIDVAADTQTISAKLAADVENDLSISADGGLLAAPYKAGDGVALDPDTKTFQVALYPDGNQIMMKEAKLVVPLDYGTMD